VSKTSWKRLPYFAALGALAMLSLLMYCTALTNFSTELFPIYVTEVLLFIAIDYVLWKDGSGWNVFLMSLTWLMNQAIVWGAPENLSVVVWILLIAQVILFLSVLRKQPTPGYPNPTGTANSSTWGQAALHVVLIFALAKTILCLMYGWTPLQWISWGLAVLATTIGYLFPVYAYGKVVGLLLGVATALTISGPGLTLIG
jgi:hypothetical protein